MVGLLDYHLILKGFYYLRVSSSRNLVPSSG